MARDLITPITLKRAGDTTAASKVNGNLIALSTANGAYIKTTGVDATKMMLLVDRSSASTAAGTVTLVAGSTAGNEAFSANSLGNLGMTLTSSTGDASNYYLIGQFETARFKDTDDYIKLNFSTAMAGAKIGAILLPEA